MSVLPLRLLFYSRKKTRNAKYANRIKYSHLCTRPSQEIGKLPQQSINICVFGFSISDYTFVIYVIATISSVKHSTVITSRDRILQLQLKFKRCNNSFDCSEISNQSFIWIKVYLAVNVIDSESLVLMLENVFDLCSIRS